MLRLMGKKMRYKRFKKQTGGSALDSVFSNFKMDDFMKGLSDAFAGFSGNPQLQGIFDNSNKLFNNFQSQVNLPSEQVNGLKPLFDLFSMFTKKYEDGGEVEMEDEPSQIESVEDLLKQVFNQQYADRSAPAEDLIPGLVHTPPVMKKGGNPDKVGNKIKKLIDEGYKQDQAVAIALDMQRRHKLQTGGVPVTPNGQFDFPGMPTMVPTPNGSITMNGVNQPLLAIDQMGQMAMLPPNSGEHQFAPGMVLEIPMEEETKKKSSKPKEDYGMNFMKRTIKRFNDRNKRMTRIARTGDVGMPFGKRR